MRKKRGGLHAPPQFAEAELFVKIEIDLDLIQPFGR